jgi:hypothetical protein
VQILFLICLLSTRLGAQHHNIFSNFKSNIKRADQFYSHNSYASAVELYKKVLSHDTGNSEVKLKIAHCFSKLNKPAETESWYEKIIYNTEKIKPIDKLYYAEALLSNGKYDEARKWFHEYSQEDSTESESHRKNDALFSILEEYKDSLNYRVSEASINSKEADFSPAYYDHGIVFLSARKETKIVRNMSAAGNVHFLDLYYSSFAEGDSLSLPVKFDKNLNTKFHEGPVAFFDKGNKIIFTRNNYNRGKSVKSVHGVNHLVLFYAERDTVTGEWINVSDLPFNSSEFSTSHPSFSSKTKTLYFVSDRPGGYGGTDIYESNFRSGNWSNPRNLGNEINTEGQEMFPFVYKDSILFFSSNGHPGLGGLDLYSANISEGKITEVKSFNYPINSGHDDFGLIMGEDGESGYFSSNRKGGTGDDDIYYYKINSIKLIGITEDNLEEKPLGKVTLRLFEQGSQKEIKISGEDGKFFFKLKGDREYVIKAKHDDYKEAELIINTRNYSFDGAFITKILMDKKNKSYVKVTVKDSTGQVVRDAKLRVLHKGGKEHDLVSDEKGEVHCEIDGDLENIFIAEKDGKAAMERLKVHKKKKGSTVLNIDLELEPYKVFKIEGVLKNEKTGLPLSGYELLVKNIETEEEFPLCSDGNGHFIFNGVSYGNYTITSFYGVKKGVFEGIRPYKDMSLEIFWSGKE